jgi:TRAP-type C4-dicarboxylate transport system substrate-binding protein
MKRCINLSIASLIALFFVSVFPAHVFAQKTISLRFSSYYPAPHKNSLLLAAWCKEVEKRTKGRVKVKYYSGSTLTPPSQTYDSIVNGIADVGWSALAYTRGKFPLSEVLDLPLGYKSALVATRAANEYIKAFQPKEFNETQLMYLSCHAGGVLLTKKPVRSIEEMKGMKIRASGLATKLIQALGGAPVGMPFTEVYDALSKGVAQGTLGPWGTVDEWKLAEVVSYVTEFPGSAYTTSYFVAMNKEKWNSLPPDVQKIIEQINQEWIEKHGHEWDEMDRTAKQTFAKKGGTVFVLSKEEDARWVKAVQPILSDYAKENDAKGLPGSRALKFLQDYLKANNK